MKNKSLFNMVIKNSKDKNVKLTKKFFYEFLNNNRKRIEKSELNKLWEEFKKEIIRYYTQEADLSRKKTYLYFNIHESLIRHSIEFYNNLDSRPYGYVALKTREKKKKEAIINLNQDKENISRIQNLLEAGFKFDEVLKTLNIEIICALPNGTTLYMKEKTV